MYDSGTVGLGAPSIGMWSIYVRGIVGGGLMILANRKHFAFKQTNFNGQELFFWMN